jgi:hypothetical protein
MMVEGPLWHKADIAVMSANVRSRGQGRHRAGNDDIVGDDGHHPMPT